MINVKAMIQWQVLLVNSLASLGITHEPSKWSGEWRENGAITTGNTKNYSFSREKSTSITNEHTLFFDRSIIVVIIIITNHLVSSRLQPQPLSNRHNKHDALPQPVTHACQVTMPLRKSAWASASCDKPRGRRPGAGFSEARWMVCFAMRRTMVNDVFFSNG